MKSHVRNTAAVAMLSTAVLLAACNKPADKPADADAAKPAAEGEAGTAAVKIPGLATDKQQASYMIGMRMAKQLEQIKGEVDVDTIARAMKSQLASEKMLMTDEQANQVEAAFGDRMRVKMMEEQMAKARKNAEAGPKFLAENAKKPGIQTTASGLQYQVVTEGKGAKAKEGDVVKVQYKGTELDGKVFDSSYDRGEPATIPLGQVVPGWREGILLMPIGSKYKFWLPANLGYGENPPPGAPFGPNAVLSFEVELLDVVKPPVPAAQ